jgi:hypothetical protein
MNAANQAQNMQKWGEENGLAGRKSVKKALFYHCLFGFD